MKTFLIRLFPNATKAWAGGVASAVAGLVGALYPDIDPTALVVIAGAVGWGVTWLLPNMKVPS